MAHTGRYHGGLVFQGNEDGAIDRFSRVISATLEDYGHSVERQSISNPCEARVVSGQYHVRVVLETLQSAPERCERVDAAAGLNRRCRPRPHPGHPRLRAVLTLTPAAPGMDSQDVSELLLVVMLYRMVDIFATEGIEWLDPGEMLSVEQFLGAFANVSPRRVRGRQQILHARNGRFAPVDDTAMDLDTQYERIVGDAPHRGTTGLISLSEEEELSLAFRWDGHPRELEAGTDGETDADGDLRRLTSWGMTGCLAFVSAPVAVSMVAVNLIRGEDFRLNTQVLSLTSALVVLQSTGAMAGVLSYMPV